MDAWYRLDEEGILEDGLINTMWKDIWDKEPSKKDAVVSNIDIFILFCEFMKNRKISTSTATIAIKTKYSNIYNKHFQSFVAPVLIWELIGFSLKYASYYVSAAITAIL